MEPVDRVELVAGLAVQAVRFLCPMNGRKLAW